ncbi:MAG TPA: hypothetical protein VG319_01950 [Polyangia bacterium]|nr:hypothetical protein [Polyangia bacterium]
MPNLAMIVLVRALTRGATLLAAVCLSATGALAPAGSSLGVGVAQARSSRRHAHARAPRPPEAKVTPGLRVSVQPIEGERGPALRDQIARLLRARGCRVVMTLPRVDGTGQYLTMARDNRLAAFVSADIEKGRSRESVTFLVWDGASGSVLGRWSASAAPKTLPKTVAKGFWKNLGARFEGAAAPASDELGEAPPMYVNAGEPLQ